MDPSTASCAANGAPAPPASDTPPAPPSPPPPPFSPTLPDADQAKPSGENDASQLTELFRKRQAAHACALLQELGARCGSEEVHKAFQAVEWAPNAFLRALAQWPSTAPRNTFYTLVHAGVECMKLRPEWHDGGAELPPPNASDLAGALLVDAFADCRAPLVVAFAQAFHVSITHVEQHCLRLLDTQIKHVVTVLDKLNARQLLHVEIVVEAAIVQNDLDAADMFVRDNAEHQRFYLQQLIERRFQDKMIKKRMNKFHLSERSFPDFYDRRLRAQIRFLLYNHQYEDVLAVVRDDVALGLYACHFLLDRLGKHDAVVQLFVHRSGLTAQVEGVDTTTTLTRTEFPNQDDLEPLATCLSLTELLAAAGAATGTHGEASDGVTFVDTPAQLTQCVAHLLRAPIVGFDCEWKTATTQGGRKSEACAVLQLASATRAFVVDTIALKGQCGPLHDVFASETVLKLGFDAKQDVAVVAKVLYTHGDPRHDHGHALVRNLVDIQTLAKRLGLRLKRRMSNPTSHRDGEGDGMDDGEIVEDAPQHGDAANTRDSNTSGRTSRKDRSEKKKMKKMMKKVMEREQRARRTDDRTDDSGSSLSLASVAETYLGKPLDKRSRMSDWERRPLTTAQLRYAALDALVLVAIFDRMKTQFPEGVVDQELQQMARPRSRNTGKKK